jgi:transcriptional regulator with XRE-family HTH domain
MTQFSARIKEVRKERKLTQKQMAELLETTERNYQYYESGAREPNLETFVAISDILNISTDYLVGRSDNPRRLP